MHNAHSFALTVVVAAFAFISDSLRTVRPINENFSSNRIHTLKIKLFTLRSGEILIPVSSGTSHRNARIHRRTLREIVWRRLMQQHRANLGRRHEKDCRGKTKYIFFQFSAWIVVWLKRLRIPARDGQRTLTKWNYYFAFWSSAAVIRSHSLAYT